MKISPIINVKCYKYSKNQQLPFVKRHLLHAYCYEHPKKAVNPSIGFCKSDSTYCSFLSPKEWAQNSSQHFQQLTTEPNPTWGGGYT